MSQDTVGPVHIDGTTLRPWDVFERHIAAYLSTMFDPEDTDRLTLHAPNMSGGNPWVVLIKTVNSGRGLMISYPWDDAGSYVDDFQDTGWRLRMMLEERLNVPHPALLTVEASGPASRGVGILGLATHEDGERPTPQDDTPSRREVLLHEILTHAQHEFDPEIELDEDGDVPLLIEGVRLWVRVHHNPLVVQLFTRVVDDVASAKRAGTELAVVNRRYIWSRWTYRRGDIWQRLCISPTAFSMTLFDEMLEAFVANHHDVADDLIDRLDGTAAFS